ncbi:unnamed protein product, partial [Didymodactylos carnosus]
WLGPQADYIKKGIAFADIATKEDEQKNYKRAYENYLSAAEWILLAKKHGNMNEDTKVMITRKAESYINRAEQIRILLREKNGDDDDDDEVDPEKKKMAQKFAGSIVSETKVSFHDVVGLDQAKEALKEAVILPIKFPRLFTGSRKSWAGILLYGPRGTGKSYLAKATATECKSTFISVSSADLLSKWLGESEKSVRYVFELAREKQPAIVFIDEIDALCSTRTDNESESARRIKTEFLVQMEGVRNNQGVLILAATNIPWGLDSAIRRQFEKRIYIPLPDQAARRSMFKLHLGPNAQHTLTENDWTILSQKSENYSGADIAVVVKNPQRGGSEFLWAACSPGDPQAIELTLDEIKADELYEPPVTMGEMLAALSTKKATVGAADLSQHQKFTEEYGQEGS